MGTNRLREDRERLETRTLPKGSHQQDVIALGKPGKGGAGSGNRSCATKTEISDRR